MLLQEPVQAAVWDALNHYDYRDATFLAERLCAEVVSDETLYLLATCYFRSGKQRQTYALLQKRGYNSPELKYLYAKCCMHVEKFSDAEFVLAGNILTRQKTMEDIEKEFGNLASHVFNVLGAIYTRTDRNQKAIECYKKSLKLNPLLWSAFEGLCQLGEKVDPTSVFPVPTQACTTILIQNTKEAHTVQNTPPIIVSEILTPVAEVPSPQPVPNNINLCSPQNLQNMKLLKTPEHGHQDVCDHTPENRRGNIHDQLMASIIQAPKSTKKTARTPMTENRLRECPLDLLTQYSPSFGILPINTPSPESVPLAQNLFENFITPSPAAQHESNNESKAPRKPITRRANQNQTLMPKPPPFNLTGNTQENNSNINTQNNPPNVRRSSRLFSHSSSSVKENNKQQSKTRFTSPKAVVRKSKTRLSKSKQDISDVSKGEIIMDSKPAVAPEPQPQIQLVHMQQQSLAGILTLLQAVGKAYQAMSEYSCRKAIELFQDLPQHQMNTGWVLSQIGRAHFELQEYHQAEKTFREILRKEPYHTEGMEIYSTTLWHLQKEVELSYLAQELTEMDKISSEACCATGNCFSLQREHETAIKFFNRAIQIDPSFAYAYTLLGHEFVYTEELDNAMACFRSAIRVSPRHYNAWYGVGLIYMKQEKFRLAEIHFRKALMINPQSSPLLCHIGVVLHAQQKSDQALATLDKAMATDPKNPLCKFHRATILFAKQKHKEALAELEELKRIIPKESLIYFLLGKVHKKLGNTDLSLMNFSWAMDLDPKGLNNHIKESIEKRFNVEDEDSLVRLYESDMPEVAASGSNSSLMDADDMLQAVESDESL
ncbi:cell division cycle protein 27 homolog [Ruditapes philippinarum]|uniref:cell division cycle protein 27 homolog n=1 Tax=Ruditapes philippinarum TaxID=129788 RepID=UPI00295B1AC4|nr:cell division cycle protein 27 homolog [Ruditapes philippinarum]